MELTHGSLFSGIGGFDLGFERAGFRSVWQVETDPYCQAVLSKRFPEAKLYSDIRSVHGVLAHAESKQGNLCESRQGHTTQAQAQSGGFCPSCLSTPTVLTGGFPCQPFSVAGKRRGKEDDRSLWPEMLRVIAEVRPRWVVAENVPGIIKMALDQVLSDLEAIGYTVGAVTIPACAVDAPHRRERLWVLAYSTNSRVEGMCEWKDATLDNVSNTQRERFGRRDLPSDSRNEHPNQKKRNKSGSEVVEHLWKWLPEPNVGRVAHGVPSRVDRLKSIGNAVVPQIVEWIAWRIRNVMEFGLEGKE